MDSELRTDGDRLLSDRRDEEEGHLFGPLIPLAGKNESARNVRSSRRWGHELTLALSPILSLLQSGNLFAHEARKLL